MVQFSSFQSGIKKQIRCASHSMTQAQSVSTQSPAPTAPIPAVSRPMTPGTAAQAARVVAQSVSTQSPAPTAHVPAVSHPTTPGTAARAAGVVGSPVATGRCLFSSQTMVPNSEYPRWASNFLFQWMVLSSISLPSRVKSTFLQSTFCKNTPRSTFIQLLIWKECAFIYKVYWNCAIYFCRLMTLYSK